MRLRQLSTTAVFMGLAGTLIAQTADPRPIKSTMRWSGGHEVSITAASVQGDMTQSHTYTKAKIIINGVTIFADEAIVERD
jgi:hypothetical protein